MKYKSLFKAVLVQKINSIEKDKIIMMLRILAGILFVAHVYAMQNESASDKASKQLYGIMAKAHTKVNKRCLLPEKTPFDPSEESILPTVQQLLNQEANPNCKFYFGVPTGIGEGFSIPLPTSMELAQQLGYKKIEQLFSLPIQNQNEKNK